MAVKEAVSSQKSPIFPLLAEFEYSNNESKLTEIPVDWEKFTESTQITPVIRIHFGGLKDKELTKKIAVLFKKLPNSITSLQIDLDCPESKLHVYHQKLSEIRSLLPDKTEVSITALPCHLNNPHFEELLKEVDYFVVQVHGTHIPKHIDDNCQLMNLNEAKRSIIQAEKLQKPFKIALPTYAYRLFFNEKTGDSLRISAENYVKKEKGQIERIFAPKLKDLAELVKFIKKRKNLGVIWFRLPVPGDRLCLSLKAVEKLSKGEIPSKGLEFTLISTKNGSKELYLHNSANLLAKKVEITLRGALNGEYDLNKNFTTDRAIPGLFPSKISGPSPVPGKPLYIGWFRPENNHNLEISVKCLENF